MSEQGDGHLIAWHNMRVPKSKPLLFGYLLAELVALTLTVFLTAGFVRDMLRAVDGIRLGPNVLIVSGLFMAVAWVATITFGLTLVRLTWTESILIQPEQVVIQSQGLLSRAPKLIDGGGIWRISYEKLQTRQDRDTRFTVNIFHQDGRDTVGFWMRTTEKKLLFELLQRAIAAQGWPYVDFRFSERPGQARDELGI